MSTVHLFCLLTLAAAACAQDTNFPVGPQYLITSDSKLLQPIATPTLSLSEPLPPIENAPSEETTVSEPPAQPVTLSLPEFFARVYWGGHTPEQVTGRLIVTPTLSLSEPPATPSVAKEENEAVRRTPAQSAARRTEIRAVPPPNRAPSSLVRVGVAAITDARSLRELGYGVSLGEAALSARTMPHATRIFTNRDIERLHVD